MHISCLDPPLTEKPIGGWVCASCVVCRSCDTTTSVKIIAPKDDSDEDGDGTAAAPVGSARIAVTSEADAIAAHRAQKIEAAIQAALAAAKAGGNKSGKKSSKSSAESAATAPPAPPPAPKKKTEPTLPDPTADGSSLAVGTVINTFQFGGTMCSDCADRYHRGEYCPTCKRVWRGESEADTVCQSCVTPSFVVSVSDGQSSRVFCVAGTGHDLL